MNGPWHCLLCLVRPPMPDTGRIVNRWSECLRLWEDHHDAGHAWVDRAVIVVGPGVREGDAVAALKGESGADGRVQVLLGEQDARCSLPIDVRITGRRRGLAEIGEVIHLHAGAGVPDVRGEASGRWQLQLTAAGHAARLVRTQVRNG